jgi:hypothetical protein
MKYGHFPINHEHFSTKHVRFPINVTVFALSTRPEALEAFAAAVHLVDEGGRGDGGGGSEDGGFVAGGGGSYGGGGGGSFAGGGGVGFAGAGFVAGMLRWHMRSVVE